MTAAASSTTVMWDTGLRDLAPVGVAAPRSPTTLRARPRRRSCARDSGPSSRNRSRRYEGRRSPSGTVTCRLGSVKGGTRRRGCAQALLRSARDDAGAPRSSTIGFLRWCASGGRSTACSRAWFHGKNFDLDFKERAFHMSDREIARGVRRARARRRAVPRHRHDAGPDRRDRRGGTRPRARGRLRQRHGRRSALADAGHEVFAVDVTLGSATATRTTRRIARSRSPGSPTAVSRRARSTRSCARTRSSTSPICGGRGRAARVARRVDRRRAVAALLPLHGRLSPALLSQRRPAGAAARRQRLLVDGDSMLVSDSA